MGSSKLAERGLLSSLVSCCSSYDGFDSITLGQKEGAEQHVWVQLSVRRAAQAEEASASQAGQQGGGQDRQGACRAQSGRQVDGYWQGACSADASERLEKAELCVSSVE